MLPNSHEYVLEPKDNRTTSLAQAYNDTHISRNDWLNYATNLQLDAAKPTVSNSEPEDARTRKIKIGGWFF